MIYFILAYISVAVGVLFSVKVFDAWLCDHREKQLPWRKALIIAAVWPWGVLQTLLVLFERT